MQNTAPNIGHIGDMPTTHRFSYTPEGSAEPIEGVVRNSELFLYPQGASSHAAVPIDGLGLNEKDKVNLLAKAVYVYNKHGYDPDASATKVSACHVVRDESTPQPVRRIFMGANAGHRARSQRFDAETVALAVAKNSIGVGHFMVEETYLAVNTPGKEGVIRTPCGTCREELTAPKYIDPDAALYCLPYQSPESAELLDVDDQTGVEVPDVSKTPKGSCFKQNMMALVPFKNLAFASDIGEEKAVDVVAKGLRWVQDQAADFAALPIDFRQLGEMQKAVEQGREGELTYLQGEGFSMDRVNAHLCNKIKAAYRDVVQRGFPAEELHKIRASLVRLEDGRVFSSLHIDAEGLGAKPLGEMSALSNAYNPSTVNEVFVMEMDPKRIVREQNEAACPTVRGTYPEALDRLFKSAKGAIGKWTQRAQDGQEHSINSVCMVHSVPLNDGSLTSEQVENAMLNNTIEELYPGPFGGRHQSGMSCC